MLSGPAMAPAAWLGAGSAAAAAATQDEMRWRQLDSGVSAVSFGFVATAILVSMFLAMAILEHFLRGPARARGMDMGMGMEPPFAPSPHRGGSSSAFAFSSSAAAAPAPARPASPARISRRPGSSTAARLPRCLFMPKVYLF